VSYNAALGLYSTLEIGFTAYLWGIVHRNFKVTITPFAYNPLSITAAWAHPIAVSQGKDMSATVDIGYDMTLGDVQLYYNFDELLPKISLLDYMRGTSDLLVPPKLEVPSNPFLAMMYKLALLLHIAPPGWAWSQEYMPATGWVEDPYANFNLGDWMNKNTETAITTSGNYLDTIDFFAAYNEEQTL